MLPIALALTMALPTPAQMTSQEAMNMAQQAASGVKPSDFVTSENASNTVNGFGADVSAIEQHFNKGQGDLLGPGGEKVTECLSGTSMECRAVQAVLDAGTHPGFPDEEFEDLLAGADFVKGEIDKLPGDSGGVICETITTTTPPSVEFQTCENAVNSKYENCFSGWSSSMEFETLFKCISRTQKVHDITCQNPYVTSVDEYTCVEAPRQSCTVGTEVSVTSDYVYKCQIQSFANETYRCNKVLDVVGFAGCEPGKMQQAQVDDPSHLGTDSCNGGDMILAKFACSDAMPPLLRIETNVKNASNFGFDIQAMDFDVEREFSNCKGRWRGKTRCTGVNCTTEINFDVFYRKKGSFHHSGFLRKVFGYTTYSQSSDQDTWRDTCAPTNTTTLEMP